VFYEDFPEWFRLKDGEEPTQIFLIFLLDQEALLSAGPLKVLHQMPYMLFFLQVKLAETPPDF